MLDSKPNHDLYCGSYLDALFLIYNLDGFNESNTVLVILAKCFSLIKDKA